MRTENERFEKWIDRHAPGGHWLWTGATSGGYGVMAAAGAAQMVYVHRWAYETFVGPIPEGMFIGHVCHDLDLTCPGGECFHRRCANPEHLQPMTLKENNQAGRGAQASRARRSIRDYCSHGHELTPENLFIRPRDEARICRVCQRAAVRDSRARRTGIPAESRVPMAERTHCPQGHPYDEANTYIYPSGSRSCRACGNARSAAWKLQRV